MPKSSIAISVVVTHDTGFSVESKAVFEGNELVMMTVQGAEISADARKSAAVPYLRQGASALLDGMTGFNMDPPIRAAIAKSVENWPKERADFELAQAQWDADVETWKANGSPGSIENFDPNEHAGHGCEFDPLVQQN
jgi:hypothetical protein